MRFARCIAALMLAACACAAFAESAAERDEAIYAAALASVNPDPKARPTVVVEDRTATLADIVSRPDTPAAELHQLVPSASAALVEQFVSAAKTPHALAGSTFERISAVKVEVVSRDEVDRIFGHAFMADAWRQLAAAHSGARSAVILSPPGYDEATGTALVYLRVECGGLCGGGNLLYLVRKDGTWHVAQTHPTWRS